MELANEVSRRSFIKKAATGVAAGMTPLPDNASSAGANDRVRVPVGGIPSYFRQRTLALQDGVPVGP
ncbi:MAG: twin-arginine translocation signal domain-containing protein [Phycisphaerales bacterium]|nr:MAG: twin-arginine translocation signal domain-containing protein [Phycisphaerales bacterium]